MKGIVIAGTHSGCGKTTVTLGIMAALRKKGLDVQPFKAGPDFIDAGLHRLVAARPSRNLDQWMCGREYVLDSFARHTANADIAVIEGVMGLYDGDLCTASLARLLDVPVVLVVDAYGMAESAGAVVSGFAEFGVRSSELVKLAGVIFNRVASENHYNRLKGSVKDVPVLGYLPRELDFEIPHRHLGLTIAEEDPIAKTNLGKLADAVLQCIDIDRIYESATLNTTGRDGIVKDFSPFHIPHSEFRIAVASDKAFSFYYEDNLEALRNTGAEIIRFSPLADRAVPANADAVYIGGGYPELNAEALSLNAPLLASVRAWADAGKPLYAECGGMMYLSAGISDFEGRRFPMAGVFPFETVMTKKPRLGYREIQLAEDCILGRKGERFRGHEFHYSEIADDAMRNSDPLCSREHSQTLGAGFGRRNKENEKMIYAVRDARGREKGREGYCYKNTLASYVHVHFGSNPLIAEHLADFIKGERIG